MPRSNFFWSVAVILGDVVVAVVVVVVARRTRPRAMPLATMTMKTQTHGFLNFYLRTVVMGLRSAALRAAGELRYYYYTVIMSHFSSTTDIFTTVGCATFTASTISLYLQRTKIPHVSPGESEFSDLPMESSHEQALMRVEKLVLPNSFTGIRIRCLAF